MLPREPVTTPVTASVQTGEAPSLGREADPRAQIGLTPDVGGCARLDHWLTPGVTISVLAARSRSMKSVKSHARSESTDRTRGAGLRDWNRDRGDRRVSGRRAASARRDASLAGWSCPRTT